MSSLRKSTVYVIDDDPDVLGSLRFLLEAEGFETLTFRTASAALEASVPRHADCFIIDYKMPGMNGLDLVSRLHGQDVRVPIILITGDPDETIAAKAMAAGVHYVLRKPHLEESLIAHVRQAMQDGPAATGPS
ncbi:MAG: response regulator [Afipia felis]|jgi:FixJ family two-component response regulator|uniref:C4-dicarboxylate transport transcriptional regulatory protein dctD n=2 Tax=Afipia felis TaxID=1035 RepID=A0A380WBU0_AFIFE|nr:response regulator [Afipia felis]EKS29326.1 hypothetical protein HMPREF9697_01854 [Afipia felis ATCC 53690]MBN9602482.1 response regulator [Afipia felis]SUU78034.1 C4-dicarboxylate transport transcriptional regulatory protein dctD [Afipia felis]SUU86099.1 C4-dicarboxylate transport transcriptional regulatory protein dctD [Afipia felis]